MKQSALVISALFASVSAVDANLAAAKERLHDDIAGYIRQGYLFDRDVVQAIDSQHTRTTRINNRFDRESDKNWAEGHRDLDAWMDAAAYERSQEVVTPPSDANGHWGNIHYNNPQKIMDGYVAAYKQHEEHVEEWQEDFQKYAQAMQRSHQRTGKEIGQAWQDHGVKMQEFGNDIGGDIRAIQAAQPQSLAVSHSDVREDVDNLLNNVGAAAEAVRHTERSVHRADQGPDRRMQQATLKYMQQKEKINQGFADAIEYEVENFHFNAGKAGGEGNLHWSNQQQIVDKWTAPIEAQKAANQEWMNKIKRNMEKKRAIREAAKAEAKKVWPAKFAAVEQSWNRLADNFDGQPQSLASRADVKASIQKVDMAGYNVDRAVIDDVVEFANNTQAQRNTFKQEVSKYIEEKQKINQQYADAWNYNMDQIHFDQDPKTGKWSFNVDNEKVSLEKWSEAQTNDFMARQQLKEDFIRYQRSIAADKAAFKATAKAEWPAKFQAYGNAIKKFDAEIVHGPEERAAVGIPQSLITNEQADAGKELRANIYDDMNQRYALKWEIRRDLKNYFENTAGARDQLKQDAADWKAAGKRVSDMYAAAWNYQISQTKFTPPSENAPAHIELNNQQQVSNTWRSAAQADENLGNSIKDDIIHFGESVQKQRAVLKNEIQNQWVPDVEKLQNSDEQIWNEIVNFPRGNSTQSVDQLHQHVKQTVAPASLLSISQSSNLSLNEQLAYGSVFLAAMIAVAALSNKGKATKTVEFDVEDLEMTNKKESKKQIKKTLKDIMKTSNTKVTLMDN